MASVDVLTQVKICGLCSPEDAAMAVEAGADYVGVILSPGFSRAQPLERAREILLAAYSAQRVGVFVNVATVDVLHAAEQLRLDVVQLHGDESTALALRCRDAGMAVWKAIRPRTVEEYTEAAAHWAGSADGLLVDGWSAHAAGGTGARFDWNAIGAARRHSAGKFRFIAAGGLRPDNVAEAVRLLQPDVVDVSSGVESSPCRKSAERVSEFIGAVRALAVQETLD